MPKITAKAKTKIISLRAQFPKNLTILTTRSRDGGFVAQVQDLPGIFTQAESLSELIEMVNDAVRTYFEIPKKYLSYMPSYLPPLNMARDFDLFPIKKLSGTIKFQISHREPVTNKKR